MKLISIFSAAIILVSATGCGKKGAEKQAETGSSHKIAIPTVIFTINDKSFQLSEFHSYIKLQYGSMDNFASNDRVLSRLFDQFLEQCLLGYEADRSGIAVSQNDVQKYISEMSLSDKQDKYDRAFLERIVKVQKYLTIYVYKDIKNSDRELQDYYQVHLENYRKGSEVLLSQIQVREREQAIQIRAELLNNPERFEELAKRHSVAPEAASGGNMGYFEEKTLPQEMENVVFSLRIGEISPIVETPYGYHIFRVLRKKGQRLLAFSTVKDEIDQKIMAVKLQQALQRKIGEIKDTVSVKIMETKLGFSYLPEEIQELQFELQKEDQDENNS